MTGDTSPSTHKVTRVTRRQVRPHARTYGKQPGFTSLTSLDVTEALQMLDRRGLDSLSDAITRAHNCGRRSEALTALWDAVGDARIAQLAADMGLED